MYWEGKFEISREVPFTLKLGQWYHLKEVAQGNELTLFIDGKEVLHFNQERLAKGKVGLGGGGCKARFDNVVITGPNVPDAGPSGLAVEPADKLATAWGRIKQTR